MTVYDGFMAHSELDMIELRLNVLNDVVDYHVIVEAGMTHSGNPKPPIVGDALQTERFAPFADKIIYSYARELRGANSWERERYHRSLIGNVLTFNAAPEDLIIVGDADEIPNPDVIPIIHDAAQFEMDFMYYSFHHKIRQGWAIGACRWSVCQDANKIRACQFGDVKPQVFDNGGLHLSYFGDAKAAMIKIQSFMHHDWLEHTPLTEEDIQRAMNNGVDLWGRTMAIDYVPEPTYLPRYVRDNQQKYIELGWLKHAITIDHPQTTREDVSRV